MTGEQPPVPAVPPASWLRPHAAHITAILRAQGQHGTGTAATLAVALTEEAGLFSVGFSRWLTNPRQVDGESDMYPALAGVIISAYAFAHHMGVSLDDWVALKLRHVYADAAEREKR